ncbi:hypothetical protein FACS1894113_5290 [Alphaproteobacteria bacterium]|nr:hypothetical protein FACS1894113_5290 [Alphaproteobacteria bacterium]
MLKENTKNKILKWVINRLSKIGIINLFISKALYFKTIAAKTIEQQVDDLT